MLKVVVMEVFFLLKTKEPPRSCFSGGMEQTQTSVCCIASSGPQARDAPGISSPMG